MIYRVLADLVVILHLAFTVFVVVGGLLVLRWSWLAWAHLPAAAWGVWIEFANGICPLTPLENSLRRAGGLAGYSGGFVERYILSILYPEGLTREIQIALGLFVLLVNGGVYGWILRRRFREHRHPGDHFAGAPGAKTPKERQKG